MIEPAQLSPSPRVGEGRGVTFVIPPEQSAMQAMISSYKTTTIGTVLIALGVVLALVGVWSDAALSITAGFGLVAAKDAG